MRGRVTAVNNVFVVASNEVGGLESGVTAYWFGLVPSIVIGGMGAVFVALACAAVWPAILSIGSLVGLRPADVSQNRGAEISVPRSVKTLHVASQMLPAAVAGVP
jgi:hypothetical protein